jgi:hypothetical protein
MIFDFNRGHTNGKKVVWLAVYALLHSAFLALFGRFLAPQGGPLSGLRPILTLFFQLSQSRRQVWNNKIKKIAMGPRPSFSR